MCRSLTAGFLSCITVAFSSHGAIEAFAVSADEVPQSVYADMEKDYYSIEPVDTELLSFSEYYDIYSDENRPDSIIEIKGID